MLDLFTPQVPLEHCHPNFLGYMARPQSHRDEMLAWSDGFVDRDGKFVIEFQTTFNAVFWELYVFACLTQMGFTVDFSTSRPSRQTYLVVPPKRPRFKLGIGPSDPVVPRHSISTRGDLSRFRTQRVGEESSCHFRGPEVRLCNSLRGPHPAS
jgi:hypothetical protein